MLKLVCVICISGALNSQGGMVFILRVTLISCKTVRVLKLMLLVFLPCKYSTFFTYPLIRLLTNPCRNLEIMSRWHIVLFEIISCVLITHYAINGRNKE